MKKKNSDKFVVRDIFLDEFSFLIEEYNFSLIKKEVDTWFTEVKYANKCCVITVYYEVKDFYFNVIISQLVDGKEVHHPGSFLFTRMMFFTNTRYMMWLTCYRQKTVRAMMKKKD
jgi:hypothetical protein